VAEARADLVHCLRSAGADEGLVDDVRLCISEFATNAVLHALPRYPGSTFVVIALLARRYDDVKLRVEVHDPAGWCRPAFPEPGREPDFNALSGRGLEMVGLLADNCGYGASLGGWKQVWAEFTPHGMHTDSGRWGRGVTGPPVPAS
jgi:anti-sigma regulatory factor (Ser/Thr protein kinase)